MNKASAPPPPFGNRPPTKRGSNPLDRPIRAQSEMTEKLALLEEQVVELEVALDARVAKLEAFEQTVEEAMKTIGESLQALSRSCQTLNERLSALERWRKGE